MNQLHQIALKSPSDVAALLVQKYQLPNPENIFEMAQAVDYASVKFGNNFIGDLYAIDRQKADFEAYEMAYKQKLDSSNSDQLKEEIIRLDVKLRQSNDLAAREYILDKIAYTQKLLLQKRENQPANSTIQKQNQLLLMGIAAIALMFVGSKIIK